jgi:putative flippase GtrA
MRLLPKKDFLFGISAGFFIGLLFLPVFRTASASLYGKLALYVVPFFLVAVPAGLSVAALVGRKIPIIWQIGKFGVIGVLNSFFDLGILSGITILFHSLFQVDAETTIRIGGIVTISCYTAYKTTSFMVANVNSYFWNKWWTFGVEPEKKDCRSEFPRFFAVSIVGLILNVSASSFVFRVGTGIDGMTSGQWGLVAALVGIFAGLAWNFVGYKLIVFRR